MQLKKSLLHLGLSENEAALYLTCLELGSASVYKISKKSGLPRSTCYEVLESLRIKNIVSVFHKQKIKYYNPEDPKIIISKEKQKIEEFEKMVPEFNALYASKIFQPKVRFYEGIDGMKLILEEILAESKQLHSISSRKELFNTLKDYLPNFTKKRIAKKIPLKIIYRESPEAQERKMLGPQELRQVKMIPAIYEHHGLIIIWNNKIAMFSLKQEMDALIIESKEIAQMQKAMFDYMWDSAK